MAGSGLKESDHQEDKAKERLWAMNPMKNTVSQWLGTTLADCSFCSSVLLVL